MNERRRVLVIIVFAQFCCTSLWFAGNGVLPQLAQVYALNQTAIGHITSAVQFGFITGTLVFALYTIADRFAPARVFFISALFGAIFNVAVIIESNTFGTILILRFLTGFFLAGIYPVGMKIAADYFNRGLGKSLGYLVGALVVGTAFPHLVNAFTVALPWKSVLIFTSIMAMLGGSLLWAMVPNGPYRKKSSKPDLTAWYKVFKNKRFRAAAFGYFGHMWELYAFWAFVPVMLEIYTTNNPSLNISFWSFLIIGLGGLACVAGGYISGRYGPKITAGAALFLSGICCLISPLVLQATSPLVLAFLIGWGLFVIADSPLFSTVVAKSAPEEQKGTALTITNCIGFSITILSIQLLNWLLLIANPVYVFMVLALGPAFGVISLILEKEGDK